MSVPLTPCGGHDVRSVTAVVSCPMCGADEWTECTQRVNELRGVLSAECAKGHAFAVLVEVVGVRWTDGCGTYGGYKRHRREGEEPCSACVAAASALRYDQKRWARERARVTVTAEPAG